MTHPLTDEMIEQIAPLPIKRLCEGERYFATEAARWSADWQLERDAEYFAQYLVKHFGLAPEVAELRAEWFKEAMRPQEDN